MAAPTVQLEPSDRSWLPAALEVLEGGRLVVLPTETVYGVAARADDPRALERLRQAKGRPPGLAFTWHVASPAALEAYPGTGACARRLAERYWPGPLTLVLPGVPAGLEEVAREGWTGLRCTAGEFSSALCEAAPFPVVMTSANAHGQAEMTEAGELAGLELAGDDLVLEAPGVKLPGSSTVLLLGGGRFELLREGLHDLERLRATAGLAIGFACTGNTCRSPMAEGIARAALARRLGTSLEGVADFGFRLESMGVMAAVGAPAAEHAVATLRERDIDISRHVARQATPEGVAELDRVYCLTESHRAALASLLPPKRTGHLELLDPEGRDIPDPIGGSAEVYRACAERIEACIEARLEDWA